MTTTSNQTKMCEAIKKDGSKCSYKSKCGSKFCGVHKNFIDTSKPLFTEDIEEKEKLTLNFMTGENIKINKGHTLDYILNSIKLNNPLDNYNYSIFRDGAEDKITDNTYKFNDDNYFCMPSQKFTYKEGDYIYRYAKFISGKCDDYINKEYICSRTPFNEFLEKNDGFNDATYYKIVKRTKCYITLEYKDFRAFMSYGEGGVELGNKYGDYMYNFHTEKFKIHTNIDGNETCRGDFYLPVPDAEKFKGY